MNNSIDILSYLPLLGIAFTIAFAIIYSVNRWSLSKNIFMDAPDKRKVHLHPIPRIGGIGIIIATLFTMPIFSPLSKEVIGIISGCSILFIFGIIDDYKEIRPRTKFIGQVIACLITIAISDIYLKGFGDILAIGEISFPPNIGIPITVIAIIGMINAINFIDGLDGLAAGISIISLIGFGLLAYLSGNTFVLNLSIPLIGALLAFLLFNWHPARIFMGDSGSLCVGYILGFLAVALTQTDNTTVPPVVALLILGLPVGDTIWVMTRRVIHCSSPFKADQGHLHHKLISQNFSHRTVVLTLYAWSTLLTATAISSSNLSSLPEYVLFYCYVLGSIFIYSLFSIHLRHNR